MKQKQKQVKQMFQLHGQKAESFQCFSGIETETMFHLFHSRQIRVEKRETEPTSPTYQPSTTSDRPTNSPLSPTRKGPLLSPKFGQKRALSRAPRAYSVGASRGGRG